MKKSHSRLALLIASLVSLQDLVQETCGSRNAITFAGPPLVLVRRLSVR